MNGDDEWVTLYDQLFLTFPVRTQPNFYELVRQSSTQRFEWQKLSCLPELFKLFELLQNFISDHRNWMKKSCSQSQIETIEDALNNLMITLQCQKIYGCQFWQNSKRRMQASIIHFYILLKMFVVALIPVNFNSLMHANSQERLMTEISRLENLVNQIIELMKPIHAFMYVPAFSNEIEFTNEFFKELSEFFTNLPKINKESMKKNPRIMEFINVCLEIDNIKQGPILQRNKIIQSNRGSLKNDRQNHFINKPSLNENTTKVNTQLFKFDQRIRIHTSYLKRKKLTVTSIQTNVRSQSNERSNEKSNEKQRSPTLDRSLSLFQSERLKRSTFNQSPRRQNSNSKIRQRLLTSKTYNSSGSRQRSRRTSFQAEIIEQQREEKTGKKKIGLAALRVIRISQQVNLEKGVSRGWGIIRQYVNKKVAERKLRNLLLL